MPEPPEVFAEPNFEVLEGSLGADVILINAPAAVGKTTLAEQLSAVRGAPLLDLASVRVGRASLRGMLPDLGVDGAEEALLAGQTAVIIDSVDEGQLLSGPGNLEEFLVSTWDLLDGRPGEGTRIIVLGRPDTIDLVRLTLGLDARQLSVMDLRVEYFDLSEATKLVHMYANFATEEGSAYRVHRQAADGLLKEYFAAFGRALGLEPTELWEEPDGRGFAGYAPVLDALGTLIAGSTNFIEEQNRLASSESSDAWDVLTGVVDRILEREQGKLVSKLKVKEPDTLYTPNEQLGAIVALLSGFDPATGLKVRLSGNEQQVYQESVNQWIQEHPFLRGGTLANPVFAATVLTHGIRQGESSPQLIPLLAAAARQPFLFRTFQERPVENELLDGELLGYLVSSFWTEEGHADYRVSITSGVEQETIEVSIAGPNDRRPTLLVATCPFSLLGKVRNTSVWTEDEDEMRVAGHPLTASGAGTRVELQGEVEIHVGRLVVGAEELIIEGSVFLEAAAATTPGVLKVSMLENGRLGVDGAIKDSYPWSTLTLTIDEPPSTSSQTVTAPDTLEGFLDECRVRRLGPLTLNADFSVPDDKRLRWMEIQFASGYATALGTLRELGLAKTTSRDSSGSAKVLFKLDGVCWDDLYGAAHRVANGGTVADSSLPSEVAERVDQFIDRCSRAFE